MSRGESWVVNDATFHQVPSSKKRPRRWDMGQFE